MIFFTPLLFLISLVCSQLYADVVCIGESQRAYSIIRQINQEWPLRKSNDDVSKYIQQIGQRLVQAERAESSVEWHFNVIRDHSVNAFSIGNGYVYITDGALRSAMNESEIAAILAHEIGHQISGHFCQFIQEHKRTFLDSLLEWPFSKHNAGLKENNLGSLVQVVNLSKETEADKRAVEILLAAGYDPYAMLEVTKRLNEQSDIPHYQDKRRIEGLGTLLVDIVPIRTLPSLDFEKMKNKLAIE